MPQTVNIKGVGAVNFPDGYTPERIKFAIENDILPRLKQPDVDAPTGLERLGRGMADVTEGVTQLGLKAKDLFTGGDEASAFTKDKTEENARYELGRAKGATTAADRVLGKQGDPGVDWWRLGGDVAATLPAMVIPGGAAARLLPRVASGATQGAVASGSMFTKEGDSKLGQVAEGAAFGGALPALGVVARKAGGKILDKLMPASAPATGRIEGDLTLKLEKQGVDWNSLTKDVQASLVADAQKALSTGGTLDDAMLANKALIESVGAKPTKASITRNPKDWQQEQDLRGITGVGEPIAKAHKDNAAALTGYLKGVRDKTGGAAGDALDAGESVITGVKTVDSQKKAAVDEAYGKARDHVGRAAPMDSAGFSTAANKALDDGMLGAYLPTEARTILNDITLGKVPFNVNTAVQYDSVLSAAQRSAGKGSPQALAIGKVRDALNAAGIADNVGEDAKKAFDSARGLAKDRFAGQEASKGIAAAVDDAAPDRFVKKYILDADARDVRGLWSELGKTPQGIQAQKDVKGHVLDAMLMKATGAKSLDEVAGQPFSYDRFATALNAIPKEKLHTMFSPSEVESLRTLERASKLLTKEVPFSDVNYSKTTAALANILQRVGSTPLIGHLISPIIGAGKIGLDWVKNAGDRRTVAEAILGSAVKPGTKALPSAGAERLLIAPAAATFGQASQGAN